MIWDQSQVIALSPPGPGKGPGTLSKDLNVVKLVVGLGNPGPQYARTRHNLGFMCVDKLAQSRGLRFDRKQAESLVAMGQIDHEPVVLAKPQTFMNQSGKAVAALVRRHGVALRDLLVVYDDLDLPLGTLRLRERGSPGTHNGMRSVVESLGSRDFPRLRLGIGPLPPGVDPVDFVLSPFRPEEQAVVQQAIDLAADAIATWILEGPVVAMNRYNVRVSGRDAAAEAPTRRCEDLASS